MLNWILFTLKWILVRLLQFKVKTNTNFNYYSIIKLNFKGNGCVFPHFKFDFVTNLLIPYVRHYLGFFFDNFLTFTIRICILPVHLISLAGFQIWFRIFSRFWWRWIKMINLNILGTCPFHSQPSKFSVS